MPAHPVAAIVIAAILILADIAGLYEVATRLRPHGGSQ